MFLALVKLVCIAGDFFNMVYLFVFLVLFDIIYFCGFFFPPMQVMVYKLVWEMKFAVNVMAIQLTVQYS